MWALLPIVTLLVRAVAGNLENEAVLDTEEPPGEISRQKTILDLSRLLSGQLLTLYRFNDRNATDDEMAERKTMQPDLPSYFYFPLGNTISPVDKREDFFEKKSSPFSSWGGKRIAYRSLKIRRPIRVPFSSWGGKRSAGDDNFESVHRAPFNSWGGKRSAHDVPRQRIATGGAGEVADAKRTPKESTIVRERFNSWGGKRSGFTNFDRNENKFEDDETISDDWLDAAEKKADYRRKSAFNPWGGKRSDIASFLQTEDDEPVNGAKKIFFPWGG